MTALTVSYHFFKKEAPHKNHEDHIAAKGMKTMSHHNLVRKFVLMLPSYLKSNSCSGQRMENTRENTGMAAYESQKQKRGDR